MNLLKHNLHRVYKSREQCLMDFRELNVLVYPAPTSSSRCSPRPGTLLCGLRPCTTGQVWVLLLKSHFCLAF